MIRSIWLIIALILTVKIEIIQVQQMDEYCQNLDNNRVICTNFTDFVQLNLSYFKTSNGSGYSGLIFKPMNPVILDDSLTLIDLEVEDNYEIEFNTLRGFNVLSNPLAYLGATKKAMLTFKNSNIELYYENKVIDVDTCNYIIQNELLLSLLFTCKKFILESPIFSSSPICPIIFDGASLDVFEVQNINPTNKFSIIKSSLLNKTNLPNDFYDVNINKFQISFSDFVLDESILSSYIFSKLNYLSITSSFLRDIQSDLFKYFSYLKILEVQLYNFNEFILTIGSDDSWITNLNTNISVDLSNETDVEINQVNKMKFYLTDLNETYLYPNEDFCLFVNYPHSKLVVPIINTQNDLECTCTLLWLLQYKSLFQNGTSNDLETLSVKLCINRFDFDQLISKCDFQDRITLCKSNTKNINAIFI